jgi:hypothetical protein
MNPQERNSVEERLAIGLDGNLLNPARQGVKQKSRFTYPLCVGTLPVKWASPPISRLSSFFNVDFFQIKILVKTAIRNSFRGHETNTSEGDRTIRSGFCNMLLTYFITSLALCGVTAICGNQITYNTLLISYGMLMTAFAVLIEYNDLILSAEDAEILFTKPVSSQTIYWARLITLTLFVLLYSASLLLLPSVASFKFSFSKFYFMPLSFSIMMISCVVSAFIVIWLYMQLLNRISPNRITTLLTCFQVGFSLTLFYGYYKFLLYKEAQGEVSIAKAVESIQKASASGTNPFNLVLDRSLIFHFMPSAWFAGSINLLLGDTTYRSIGLSLAALLIAAVASVLVVRSVSTGYLHQLTAQPLVATAQRQYFQKKLSSVWSQCFRMGVFSRREDVKARTSRQTLHQAKAITSSMMNAVRWINSVQLVFSRLLCEPSIKAGYQLVRRYLKRDSRLRRGIFPFFGIILFYFLYGIENDQFVIDLFRAESSLDVLGAHSLYVLLPLCVLIATNATKYCSDWKAAWIFYAAPLEFRYFHLGYQLATFSRIYAPVWVMLLVFYFFKISLGSLLLQMLGILLILLLLRSLSFHFDPHLPVSQPPRVHAGFLKFTSVMLLFVAISQGLLILEYLASRNQLSLIRFFSALFIVTTVLSLLECRTVNKLELLK